VEACPVADETESSWLKASGEDEAINRDGGPAAGLMCMEMGYRMVGLIPIHVYRDAVEGADTRHPVEPTGRAYFPITTAATGTVRAYPVS
jgi:hypothetical protein